MFGVSKLHPTWHQKFLTRLEHMKSEFFCLQSSAYDHEYFYKVSWLKYERCFNILVVCFRASSKLLLPSANYEDMKHKMWLIWNGIRPSIGFSDRFHSLTFQMSGNLIWGEHLSQCAHLYKIRILSDNDFWGKNLAYLLCRNSRISCAFKEVWEASVACSRKQRALLGSLHITMICSNV